MAAKLITAIWLMLIAAAWYCWARGASLQQLMWGTAGAYAATWLPYFLLLKQRRLHKVLRFAALHLAMLFAFGVVEGAAFFQLLDFRLVFGKYMQPWENTKNNLDPKLVHVHRPHFHEQGVMHGGDLSDSSKIRAERVTQLTYDVHYDAHGFRNETDLTRADCIVLGDSFVEAATVPTAELHTTLLAEQLHMSIANLGQAWYGPQQELLVLQRFGAKLQPRLCVWVFFEGNDLSDIWRYEKLLKKWPRSVARRNSSWERSFTKNAFASLSSVLRPASDDSAESYSGMVNTPAGPQRLWFGYAGAELTEKDLSALEVTRTHLAAAHELCAAQGTKLLVVFAPTKYRVYAEHCHFEKDAQPAKWVVNDLPDRLRSALESISGGVHYLDLTPALQERAQAGELLYYPDDTHWSPAGHRVVADTLSAFVREHVLEDQGRQNIARSGATTGSAKRHQ